jgi:molybdopterin converting factor small subunit
VKVEVQLFATLIRFLPAGARDGAALLDLPDRSTVSDVVRALGIPAAMSHVALVNGVESDGERRLQSGDVITLFPPLAGGR